MNRLINKQWKIPVLIIFILLFIVIGIIIKKPSKAKVIKVQISPSPTEALIKYALPDSHRGEPPVVDFKSKGQQDGNYYFILLKNRIIKDHLTAKVWFSDKCNQFWLMDKETQYQIERHERHINGCGDADYNTAPLLDMFTIDKTTEEIYRLDNTKGQDAPFSEWAKTISKE
ncbi:MAG: hypothetical protein WA061_03130 [Microgenomates group bacterium]